MAKNSFLGTGMKFPPQIDPATGRFVTVSGTRSVKEAVYLILMTQLGERVVRPGFGSDIMSYTFMDTGTTMMSMFKRNIMETIISQEPRIADVDVDLEYNEREGAIIVNVGYVVSSSNTRDNLVFPFYLERGGETEDTEPVEEKVYAEPYDGNAVLEEEEF